MDDGIDCVERIPFSFRAEDMALEEGMEKCIVLFSGGQDSATCLLYALKHYGCVVTMGFRYGQRHDVELRAREDLLCALRNERADLAEHLGKDVVLALGDYEKIAHNALTGHEDIRLKENGIPNTFVPGRNLLFLCYAGSLAYDMGAEDIICGVGEADYSGYPDCRETTMASMEQSLTLGLGRTIRIQTPLMHRTKAETWQMALEMGGEWAVDWIVRRSHTCYEGDHEHWHEWGYGCGKCPACILRRRGWKEFKDKESKGLESVRG